MLRTIVYAVAALFLLGNAAFCVIHGFGLPWPDFELWMGAAFAFVAGARMCRKWWAEK